MLRRQIFVLALGIVASLTGALRAQQTMLEDPLFAGAAPPAAQQTPPTENWWQRWKRDYHRNQCWPEPFIAGDSWFRPMRSPALPCPRPTATSGR